MTISELIEYLKECQDPNEPELEVWVSTADGIFNRGAERVKLVKRQSVFVDCDPSKIRTVAMIVHEDENDRK